MKRRDVLKSVFAGAAAANVQAQQPTHSAGHTAAASAASSPQQAWTPMLFDDHQNQTVIALADLIIPATDTPGAKQAKVNEFIDLFLHDGPDGPRNAFLQGLGWLDGFALRQNQKPFLACTREQQVAMLTTLSAGGEALDPGHQFFQQVKGLTVQGYYTTEIGISELNKGGRVPGSYGCQHVAGSTGGH